PRRDVPRREPELEEAVVDAGRRVREIERRGAAAADGPRVEEDLAEGGEVDVQGRVSAEREAGGEKGARQALAVGDAQPLLAPPGITPEGAAAQAGAVDEPGERLVHDAGDGTPAPAAGDGGAEDRQPLQEVVGAVERVDDPL